MDNTKKAWLVVFSGLGVNLTLGVLYSWGIISAALIDDFKWTATQTQIPYMLASAVFALTMIPGGKLQDKFGPRPVLFVSSILAGLGFFFSGLNLSVAGLTFFFGLVFGLAMGFGYSSPTPAAVKWFHSDHRGLISGIVVSGFGLAPVYIAPLTSGLIGLFGLPTSLMILGLLFFLIVFTLSFFISNPQEGVEKVRLKKKPRKVHRLTSKDYTLKEMVRTPQFYILWTMFFFGTFAGLLIIGQMSKIGLEQASISNGFLLVVVYAIFNFIGRVTWGSISDFIGRTATLFAMFAIQALVYFLFSSLTNPLALLIGKSVVGFTFGGMLAIFPVVTADFYGVKNLGVNYGVMITAWGVGGVIGPLLGGIARDITGGYEISYIVSAVLSVAGALLSLVIRHPEEEKREKNGGRADAKEN
ncbi:oxalate:formate antiporter [Mesotoga sp. HF07.pep.5.2.highcov]|uniref:Nitrate/nitrite transporter n=4 Tax=Mesotoga prima TaxID=1184387 RepID=I2F6F3_9BACT|nr:MULTISPECIES: OFA family MFS transporter [Mesotoga]MCP5461313.1 OFA family MFS transporter [Thermotogota bacterium]CCU84624.1 Major facilitator superfamily MFS_1 [Mesotoga infera]AFK07506.1 nitrate/nitrite transporter [Mesotoga prima MesG1.Ag.4.2]MCB1222769.1 OFA family MFS transporter [Mesotoga sp.]MDK2944265.1 transporter, family, oxalate/formate antiporter [Mesotoga sp.]